MLLAALFLHGLLLPAKGFELCEDKPSLCDETLLIEVREQDPDHTRFHTELFSPCGNVDEQCFLCDQPGRDIPRIFNVSCATNETSDGIDCYWTEEKIDVRLSAESVYICLCVVRNRN